MFRSGRTVIGYHGCLESTARSLLLGECEIRDWKESENDFDWLGRGIYFWEHSLERAWDWARKVAKSNDKGAKAAVVGAVIHLGECLDFTKPIFGRAIGEAFAQIADTYQAKGWSLPTNRGGRRDLDRLVLDYCAGVLTGCQSVRGLFVEGKPPYPGAGFHMLSHVQIAVRDRSCIEGIFKPTQAP